MEDPDLTAVRGMQAAYTFDLMEPNWASWAKEKGRRRC